MVSISNCNSYDELSDNDIIVVYGAGKRGKITINKLIEYGYPESKIICVDTYLSAAKFDMNNIKFMEYIPFCNYTNSNVERMCIIVSSRYYREIIITLNHDIDRPDLKVYISDYIGSGYSWTNISDFRYYDRIAHNAVRQYEISINNLKNISWGGDIEKTVANKQIEYINDQKRILSKVAFIVTNKCSLRCKDCVGRVPYFKNPIHKDLEAVKSDIDIVLSAVDEIVVVELAGGEPLLYPYLKELLLYLVGNPKCIQIRLTTNGTVLPSKDVIDALSNEKVFVGISDYGFLESMASLVRRFEESRVNFVLHSNMEWMDAGDISKRNRNQKDLTIQYANCWDAMNCKTVVDGKLFACPRCARSFMQGEHVEMNDMIELIEYEPHLLYKKICEMYISDYADACDHCDFFSNEAKVIPAGIQIESELQKSEYTITKRKNKNN